MVPVGTTAMDWWCPAISLCWRCRPTARSSIQWSGFGTICAATGSPTRCFEASPTSWTPARWRGTGSPPTPAWSARSARSPGLRLRPLYSWRLLCGLRSKTHSCPEISGDPYKAVCGPHRAVPAGTPEPVYEMSRMVLGEADGHVIVIKVAMDESGVDDNTHVITVAGYIALPKQCRDWT